MYQHSTTYSQTPIYHNPGYQLPSERLTFLNNEETKNNNNKPVKTQIKTEYQIVSVIVILIILISMYNLWV